MGADVDLLLVDDDDEIRELLGELLAAEGYRVTHATHGREALDFLHAESAALPSLILLDLMMPVMDGLEVLDELALCPRLREIPVIVTTAAPDKAVGRSFAGIVKKPYEIAVLLEEIRLHHGGADDA